MIVYAFVPGFYAQVELHARPSLRGRALVIGGDPRKRGTVAAVNAEARAAGVTPGMLMFDALTRCPQARALRTNMKLYREVWAQMHADFRRASERVEAAGLGAVYLDVAEAREPPAALMQQLRARVREAYGLPLLAGAAPVKFLAKLAAESAAADGVLLIAPQEVRAFLARLPVTRLPGVGPRTQAVLAEQGAHTAQDLCALGRDALETALGRAGALLFDYAQGRDFSVLRRAPYPRTLSQEATLLAVERDRAALGERLGELAARLARALSRERVAARRLVLKVRYADDVRPITRSRTQRRQLSSAGEMRALAEALLERTDAYARGVRALGLAAHALTRRARSEARQPELFAPR